jgi:protein-S-isoprenylcysteine O-methyltransferase Ste14
MTVSFLFCGFCYTAESIFVFMTTDLIVTIVYDLILYGALSSVALPVMFFLLWSFFDFWKKHIVTYYCFALVLVFGSAAIFYFTRDLWILWYYAFPAWVQIIGLILIVFSYLIVKLSEVSISLPVRLFYPLLKSKHFHLRTDGLYKFVRHPIYAVLPWVSFGAMLYTGQLILLPVFLFNLLARCWYASKEEQHLQKTVVGDYAKYKLQTPNRFYPKLF